MTTTQPDAAPMWKFTKMRAANVASKNSRALVVEDSQQKGPPPDFLYAAIHGPRQPPPNPLKGALEALPSSTPPLPSGSRALGGSTTLIHFGSLYSAP